MKNDKEKWRSIRYSTVFSRSIFQKLLSDGDVSYFNELINEYGTEHKECTYLQYLSSVYRFLVKNYRNEYIYKNTLLNAIIKSYGTSKSIVFNEFPVGNSIVDMAMFNGVSRAFEIKTELDTEKRLFMQMRDYTKIFQETYIVVYESLVEHYKNLVSNDIGIIALHLNRGRIKLIPIQDAKNNMSIEVPTLMKSLRTSEYKHIIREYFGYFPKGMNDFNAYNICERMMKVIPQNILSQLFINEMKGRKNNMKDLRSFDYSIRQMCLSMHLSSKDYNIINSVLNQPIKL